MTQIRRLDIPDDLEIKYSHLNRETNYIMTYLDNEEEPIERRRALIVKWIEDQDHFVTWPKAASCIKDLKQLYYKFTPEADLNLEWAENIIRGIGYRIDAVKGDMNTMALLGPSGSGKTAILKEVFREITYEIREKQGYENSEKFFQHYPIVHTVLRHTDTGQKGLQFSLLSPFLDPIVIDKLGAQLKKKSDRKKIKTTQLESLLLHYLSATRVGLYFIDEFQHAGIGSHQKIIQTEIKTLLLNSQIPFVPVGTPEARFFLSKDVQLARRCPLERISYLDYFTDGKNFKHFLKGYKQFLPFRTEIELDSDSYASVIWDKVKYPKGHDAEEKTTAAQISGFIKRAVSEYFNSKFKGDNDFRCLDTPIDLDHFEVARWDNILFDQQRIQEEEELLDNSKHRNLIGGSN